MDTHTFLSTIGKGVIMGVVLLGFFTIGLFIFGAWHDEWSGYNSYGRVSDGVCNIAVIPVHAEITPYTYYDPHTGEELLSSSLDDFEYALRTAERDPMIKGVLVSVDTPGGSGYAGEAMANALLRSALPTVAVIRDQGLSAGYWLATGADAIFASAISDVGSIGVTRSYVEYAGQNVDSGLAFIELTSAPFKEAGNPDRFLTDEEAVRIQEQLQLVHEEFVNAVARNRELSPQVVQAHADGFSMTGAQALEIGFIDALGDKESGRVWLADAIGIAVNDAILCE